MWPNVILWTVLAVLLVYGQKEPYTPEFLSYVAAKQFISEVSKKPPLPAAEKGKNENCETKSKNIILPDKKQISL